MTTKAKNKTGNKTHKKLALKKETLRDLPAAGNAKNVRGAAAGYNTKWCFGTLA